MFDLPSGTVDECLSTIHLHHHLVASATTALSIALPIVATSLHLHHYIRSRTDCVPLYYACFRIPFNFSPCCWTTALVTPYYPGCSRAALPKWAAHQKAAPTPFYSTSHIMPYMQQVPLHSASSPPYRITYTVQQTHLVPIAEFFPKNPIVCRALGRGEKTAQPLGSRERTNVSVPTNKNLTAKPPCLLNANSSSNFRG